MDLPVFRRGLELVSSQLNKLSQGIRAAQITSVIGGSFTRTPGGTTLVISQQSGGGGGGGSAYCAFKVSDYTQPADTDLIVSVQQDQINGRYPLGMDGEGGTFTVAIPAAWAEDYNWVGIYIVIEVDEFGKTRPAPEAIRVQASLIPLDGLENNQTFLLAEVTISKDTEDKPYISFIANACPLIQTFTNGLCAFQVSDKFNNLVSPPIQIEIRTGTIEGRYPDGMHLNGQFILDIPEDGEWHAVYCVLAVDSNGNILPPDNAITFMLSNDYIESTDAVQYILIGEITTSYLPNPLAYRYISFIQNYCLIPAPLRKVTTICPFQATNASTETIQQVEIQQGTVATQNYLNPYQWPDGMGIDYPPYYLEVTGAGYIYCKVVFTPPMYTISTDPTSITFLFSETLESNTSTDQYIMTATIGWDTETAKIKSITNVCLSPSPSPCGLQYTPSA